ncbi:MAG: choice-of-anchor L domain-containing protein [Flavobacteriales bacterium]|nr:choice-of-anchor L domain-containing protein [Flavobacteriales bacterium]
MISRCYILALLFLLTVQGSAQITIATGSAPSVLVDSLVGAGVTFSNVSFSGVYGGTKYQAGLFTASGSVATGLGFSSGLVLCSGKVTDIPLSLGIYPGSSNFTSSGLTSCTTGEVRQSGTCAVTENDVDILAGAQRYYNAAILEFDFVPTGSIIEFQYVFGSEEYDQDDGSFSINYNCSSYNDKFGFIISGPGISGGQGYLNDGENIARLANGSEVAINSVNNGVIGSYGGSPSAANCLAANPAWINGMPTAEFNGPIYGIQFNGNTKVLTATKSGLTSGATYHIKLIVTDVNDGAYDSGVFLKAGSFSPPVITPVELTAFDVACQDGQAHLNWSTAMEINNDYFVVEKSIDASRFYELTKVKGNGNAHTTKTYQFVDAETDGQSVYYRLKQVDFNGSYSYSNTIAFTPCEGQTWYVDQVYFNVTSNELTLDYSGLMTDEISLTIVDLKGSVVHKTDKIVLPGDNKLRVQLPGFLGAGLYAVHVTTGQVVQAFKFMVSK